MSKLSPETFISPPFVPAPTVHPPGGRFGPLVDHFAEFRGLVACLVQVLEHRPEAESARRVAAHLDMWAGFLDDAREAAARAPETDLLLTRTWGARLSDIVRDARHALRLDELLSGHAVSIARHEPAIPVSRLPKPAPQPAAGPARRRPPRLRRRRR